MKIKNFQVFDEATRKAVEDLMRKNLRGSTALKVVKVARKLDELLKDIDESVKLVREKYTVRDENGQPIHPLDDNGQPIRDRVKINNPAEFNKETEEILNIENEILPELEMITEDEIKGVDISGNTIMILSWLIKI